MGRTRGRQRKWQWNRETRFPKRLESNPLNHGVRVLFLWFLNFELCFLRIGLSKRSNGVGNKRNLHLREREVKHKKKPLKQILEEYEFKIDTIQKYQKNFNNWNTSPWETSSKAAWHASRGYNNICPSAMYWTRATVRAKSWDACKHNTPQAHENRLQFTSYYINSPHEDIDFPTLVLAFMIPDSIY